MKYLLFAILPVLLVACSSDSAATAEDAAAAFKPAEIAAQAEAFEKMIEGHDRVMARMGEIAQAQKGLQNAMAEEGISEELTTKLTTANDQLEAAYDGMMDWMKNKMVPMDTLRAMGDHQKVMASINSANDEMAGIEANLDAGVNAAKELLGDFSGDHDGHDHDHDGHDHHDHDGHDHDHDHDGHDHDDHDHGHN